ncbi:hypothetical protein [Gluconobacter oxydans]|uniref:hypothetical protein n=1 Tax=Gluconobacter oxydans TaxID=442 RepID=UPI00209CD0F8|nr:hypothetical protein [Gluconobacter oxydans]MCP1248850.1 hypothetical protein [Gluconobacter oxydans]WKE48025.1 hypothetical protein NUJ38_12135 [Gluconobacter oxydans]
MDTIKDIPKGGVIYNDGQFVHYVEHLHMLKYGSSDVFGLLFCSMTIEQANRCLDDIIESLRKLARQDYLFRTQPYTIQEIGKTTKENFEEKKLDYVVDLEKFLNRNTVEYHFGTCKIPFSGWQKGRFFWNASMRDFFNSRKHLFGGAV